MKTPALTAALVLGLAGAAYAALPPQYYEQARRDAPNVVVIKVEKVSAPFGASGDCQVRGAVAKVERGDRYKVGEAIVVAVPCATPKARLPAGPVLWQDRARLTASKQGRAFLDGQGQLALHQYDIL